MRFVSVAFSFLLAFTPSLLIAQNQPNDGQTANEVFLPQLLQENPKASIFYNALAATRLKDTLEQYLDPNYPETDYEWTLQALLDNSPMIHVSQTAVETDYIVMPQKREFKYTMFVVPDSVLAGNGIHNLDELREYAKRVYPQGADLPDTDRASSLNKLLSYHILPFWLSYDQMNVSQPEIIKKRLYLDEFDVEDFYETLLPHSIMRISTPYNDEKALGIFINRKGTIKTGLSAEGVEISKTDNNICINGGYYFVNKLLLYDSQTRENTLNTRMRIMASTLSPDFINSGARGRLNGDPSNGGNRRLDYMVYAFKPGFCKNFEWIEDQSKFYVRYRNAYFGTYYGDELSIQGEYDIILRLPPVPSDGLYEIRLWNNSMGGYSWNDRGTTLFYIQKEGNDFIPFSTPVNMNINLNDSLVGAIADNDVKYDNLTASQREAAITADDELLHRKGYLKAPDTYGSGMSLREDMNCYRKVISELYMEADKYYYLRMRQVDDAGATFAFSFIELVPYSVYSGENGPEDKH